MPPLFLGSLVEWDSQANGKARTKRGEIVEVVPAERLPRSKFDRGTCLPRDHESYVVRAEAIGRTGKRLYWPRVSGLREVKK